MIQPKLRFHLQLALGAALIVLAALTAARDGEAEGEKPIEISYEGRLQDDGGQPIAGVFPLEFHLYRTADSKAPIWRESHWVAVLDGRYRLSLGRERPLRAPLVKRGESLFLGVNLQDGGELTREALTLPLDEEPLAEAPAEPVAQRPTAPADDKPGAPPNTYKTESSFAEVADFARRAENAENAQKLGGKTLAELEAELDSLRERIADLRKAQGGGGGVTVGGQTELLQRVGGTGGGPYVRECPPGYVVTGVRGTSGAVVDSFQVICSPLQSQ
jgi:hypothetical protein